MIDPRTPAVLLLSLDSARIVRIKDRTSLWVSGIAEPSEREGADEHQFERIVPWPPVPGTANVLVWRADRTSLSGTRTSTTIAAWVWQPDNGEWAADGTTVTRHSSPALTAPTAQAAHGLAVALNADGSDPVAVIERFATDGPVLRAGADALATATDANLAATVAARLNAHPAANVLASGLAIAADASMDGYQIDPTWQMPNDPDAWTSRVERAALSVGALIHVRGTPDRWTWNGAYRHVRCGASWSGERTTIRVNGKPVLDRPEQADGPLAVLSLVIDCIDAIGDDNLLQIALNTPT